MANTSSQHGSVASEVSKSVDAQRQKATQPSQPVKSVTTNTSAPNTAPATPTKQASNLTVVSAAVAMNRSLNAPQDKPFTLSDEQKASYKEAQNIIAQKRGITPEQDGSFKQEYLANELSPKEILKYAAFEHYKETKDNQQAFKDIQQEIQNIYDNNQENPEPAPEEITSVNSGLQNKTFYTDQDFLSLLATNEKAAIEYLESLEDYPVEKANIQKLLDEANIAKHNANTKVSDEDRTGKLKKTNRDEAAKGSDEKVESKEDDIIKWMMKDVILKELDRWVDKAVDKEIALVCGTLHIAHSGALETLNWIVDKLTEPSSKANDLAKPQAQTQTQSQTQEPNSSQSQPQTQNQTNSSSTTAPTSTEKELSFEDTIKELEKIKTEKRLYKTPSKQEISLFSDLIKHNIVLEDNGYIKGTKKYPYSDFGIKLNDKSCKEALIVHQTAYTAILLAALKDSIDPDNKNTKLREALNSWVLNKNKKNNQKAKTGVEPKKDKFPEIFTQNGLTEEALNKHFERAQNTACLSSHLAPLRYNIDNSTSIFASNYTQYKLFEMARSSKEEDVKKLQDPKELKKLRTQFEAEGKILMLKNFEDLRSGDENAVTAEEMLQLSEKMAKTSKALYDSKDSKTPSPDLVEEKIKPKENYYEPKDLTSYAESLSENDVISIELNNLRILNEEEAFLKKQQNTLDDKRDLIKAMRERVNSADRNQRTEFAESLKRQLPTTKPSAKPKKEGR